MAAVWAPIGQDGSMRIVSLLPLGNRDLYAPRTLVRRAGGCHPRVRLAPEARGKRLVSHSTLPTGCESRRGRPARQRAWRAGNPICRLDHEAIPGTAARHRHHPGPRAGAARCPPVKRARGPGPHSDARRRSSPLDPNRSRRSSTACLGRLKSAGTRREGGRSWSGSGLAAGDRQDVRGRVRRPRTPSRWNEGTRRSAASTPCRE